MKYRNRIVFVWLSMLSLLVSACSALPSQATPTAEPEPVEDFTPIVSATGVLVPEKFATLSITSAGVVAEVLVEEDDLVSTGETLLRLQGEENLAAAISAAEYEVAAAEHDLDTLYKDTDLRAAEAHQAMIQSRQAVKDAQQYLNNLHAPASQADIDQAKANLLLAQIRLNKAEKDFKPYEKKSENNKIRAALFAELAEAEQIHEGTVRRYNNLIGNASELDIAEAQADLALAEEQLAVAERDYEIYSHGPDPDEVKIAEERVANAQVQLAASQSTLTDLELSSPFGGTVSEVYIKKGEWIAPGQPALLLADLENLRVETTDLNEIDVARVSIGDTAIITFDALADVVVEGTVVRIASKASEGSGVNYTAVIILDELPDDILWGMTAFVDIEVE
jgi:multidrug efflux pump subunit AcrA (membrane-fusion protein)